MSRNVLALAAVAVALAACGREEEAVVAVKKTERTVPERVADAAPEPVAPPRPTSPAPPPPPPAPARSTVDAFGTDWASHVGDIPFRLDPPEAMAQARAERRPLLLYFTQEH